MSRYKFSVLAQRRENFCLAMGVGLGYNTSSFGKIVMQLDLLLNTLKNGYTYTVDGVQQLQAPNRYMLRAHDVIVHLLKDRNQLISLVNQLQKEQHDHEAQVQHQSGVSQSVSASGPGTAPGSSG